MKNLIKVATESESKLETLKARFQEYSNKSAETSNGITSQMEGTFDIGLLGKIRAIKNAEYNTKIMKRLPGLASQPTAKAHYMKTNIESAIDYFL